MVPQTYYHVHCLQLNSFVKAECAVTWTFSAPKSFLVGRKLTLLEGGGNKNWIWTLVADTRTKTQHAATLTTWQRNKSNDKKGIRKQQQSNQYVTVRHRKPPFLAYRMTHTFTAQHCTPKPPGLTISPETSGQAPCTLFYTVLCVYITLFIHL